VFCLESGSEWLKSHNLSTGLGKALPGRTTLLHGALSTQVGDYQGGGHPGFTFTSECFSGTNWGVSLFLKGGVCRSCGPYSILI